MPAVSVESPDTGQSLPRPGSVCLSGSAGCNGELGRPNSPERAEDASHIAEATTEALTH